MGPLSEPKVEYFPEYLQYNKTKLILGVLHHAVLHNKTCEAKTVQHSDLFIEENTHTHTHLVTHIL